MNYPAGQWLYANTFFADPSVCGYYVGVANGGDEAAMFQIIRTSAEALKVAVTAVALFTATYLLNWNNLTFSLPNALWMLGYLHSKVNINISF